MIYQPFPFPSPEPLERLRVHNNLTINAERWKLAHEYHNNRQSILHQSLYQPGIISGLEVKLISAPERISSSSNYRHWVEIQPGIAIDIEGNPIIVDSQINRQLPIFLIPPTTETQIVYIVIKYYATPDNSQHPSAEDKVVERFRLDAIKRPPQPEQGEVELCRIKLNQDFKNIEKPVNCWQATANQIDFRYRAQAQIRPLANVRLGVVKQNNNPTGSIYANLTTLVESLPGLYPNLQVSIEEEGIDLNENNQINSYDLLYLSPNTILCLDNISLEILHKYRKNGGLFIIETPDYDFNNWEQKFKDLLLPSESLYDLEDLPSEHPLMKRPFLFTQLPIISGNLLNIRISSQGNIILIPNLLTTAWGGIPIPRQDIRDCHELGINILHFAWQMRNFAQLIK